MAFRYFHFQSFVFASVLAFGVGCSDNTIPVVATQNDGNHQATQENRSIRGATDNRNNGGRFIEIGPSDYALCSFHRFSDSGVDVKRVRDGEIVWSIHVERLAVPHSEYSHDAIVYRDGQEIQIHSNGSLGAILEKRDIGSGKLIERRLRISDQNMAGMLGVREVDRGASWDEYHLVFPKPHTDAR